MKQYNSMVIYSAHGGYYSVVVSSFTCQSTWNVIVLDRLVGIL